MILDLKEWETAQGLELTPATVRALASSPAFSVSPDREATGLWNVTAQRYVGLMAVGDIQIRVAPKLPVYRLVELLCESMDLPNWRPEDVLWSESDDLLTTIAASFLAHAERALQFGLVQGYLTIEDDLYAVRGRIDFGKQAGRPRELPLPIAVTFDEYTTDVLENQLLAGAGRVLMRFRTLPTEMLRRLRRLEYRLLDVTPTSPSPDPPDVTWTRLNDRYRWAVTLSRLILRSAALDFDGARGTYGSAFLVDMDKLFESVVGRGIRRALNGRGFSARLQAHDHLDEGKRLDIRPDILIDDDGQTVGVADLKYKREAANEDVYQVLAYAKRYGLTKTSLIFPTAQELQALRVSGTDVTLLDVDLNQTSEERESMYGDVARVLVGWRSGSVAA